MNKQHTKLDTLKMMFKQIGGLQIILGVAMMVPIFVSLIYKEYYSCLGFLISSIICISIGLLLYKGIKSTQEPLIRHALVIAALGWLFIFFAGAIPYLIIAYITPPNVSQSFVPVASNYMSSLIYFKNPLHAIFESMSGFTTTGLTMAVHEPSIGKGLLFYRHFSQWLGGAGFIVLAIAVLQQSSGKVALLLYGSETTGERLRPTIIETARSIWRIYLSVTAFSFLFIFIGTCIILPEYGITNSLYDSINHAMTAQSTGGFSTLDDSIAGYNSRNMETLYLLPMILGALSLPFYFKVFSERKISHFWTNLQTSAIFIFCFAGSLILSVMLAVAGTISEPFRVGIFQFVSAISTTGWQTSDVHIWDSGSVVFIVLSAMIIGGAAGATVGGLKMIRVLLIIKGFFWHLNGFFTSESSIRVVKFNQKRLLPDEMNRELASTATFAFIYLLIVLLGTLITYYTMGDGFTLKDALFESASAQGTVGLSCGITNPEMSPILEINYIIQMWTGRLEIIPVLVLFRTLLIGSKPIVA